MKRHRGHRWVRKGHHPSLRHVPVRGHWYRSYAGNRDSDGYKGRSGYGRNLIFAYIRVYARRSRTTGRYDRVEHHLTLSLAVVWISK